MSGYIGHKPPSLSHFYVPSHRRSQFLATRGRLIRQSTPVEDAQALQAYGAGQQIVPYHILSIIQPKEPEPVSAPIPASVETSSEALPVEEAPKKSRKKN